MKNKEIRSQFKIYTSVIAFSVIWVAIHTYYFAPFADKFAGDVFDFLIVAFPAAIFIFCGLALSIFAINKLSKSTNLLANNIGIALKVSAAFSISAILTSGFVFTELSRDSIQNQFAAKELATGKIDAFYSIIQSSEIATKSLAMVVKKEKGRIDGFSDFAIDLLNSASGITNLQLAPNGVISDIVPLEGHEAAIGHDLLNDPNRNKEAFEAVRDNKITLAGPFDLIQGGSAVIVRNPVFIDDKFWGFTSALVMLDDLITQSKISELSKSGYQWSLSRVHPNTQNTFTFAGNLSFDSEAAMHIFMQVPNSIWRLDILPVNGWISDFKILISGLLIFVSINLVSLLALIGIRQPQILIGAINKRTKQLADEKLLLNQTQVISKTGSWKLNLLTGAFSASDEFYRIYSLKKQNKFQIPYFYDNVHPGDLHRISNIQSKLLSGFPHDVAFRFIINDEIQWIKETAILQKNKDGVAIGIVGACQDITVRKNNEQIIKNSEERMELTLSGAELGSWDVDLISGTAIYNDRWFEMLGYQPNELASTVAQFESLLHPEDLKLSRKIMVKHLQGELTQYKADLRIRTKSGDWAWVQSTGKVFERNAKGQATRALGIHLDITDRKRIEQRLKTLSLAVENSPVATMMTSSRADIEYVNPKFLELTGYSEDEVIGRNPSFFSSGKTDISVYRQMWKMLNAKKSWSGEIWNKNKNGDQILETVSITPVLNDRNELVNFVAVKQDITKKRELEEIIWRQANYDALTGLSNRTHFKEHAEDAIERSKRQKTLVLFLFMDLNDFKLVNDQYGHDAGDRLLEEFSKRIQKAVRTTDAVSRVGGDEFAVVIENIPSIDQIESIIKEMEFKLINKDFAVKVLSEKLVKLKINVSIGASVYPRDGLLFEDLMKSADHAMYANKRHQKKAVELS